MLVEIERTSGLIADDVTRRDFVQDINSHYAMYFSAFCLDFASADALLAWLAEQPWRVAVRRYEGAGCTLALDGGPIPEWSIEIDDY